METVEIRTKKVIHRLSLNFNETESLFKQFDSIQLVSIIVELENEFDISIPSIEVTDENLMSLSRLAKMIDGCLNAKKTL